MHGHQILRKAASATFSGPKCKVAIPIENLLQRDALREASLDPQVRAIHYRKAPNPYATPPTLMGVVLHRIDGDFLLVVWERRPHRSDADYQRLTEALTSHGLRLLERDAADIRREPIYSNVREVWSNQRFHVNICDRLKIGAALSEEGPQSILELEERARPSCDIVAAVCALSCEGLLELDCREVPLGLRTLVRAL
ncbi:hypothetical protein JQ636_38525 [Bradyrhizobium japonicum]|uniref:hypothetical protein n=1 Tax=Bradyrhizobium japonicum TaxID=375 RepID=UPI001BA8499F|nr:hypothetical protein [Bradyrhizobium japonicum]MBR0734984.1 hypothetical protein [Bradyrhizobium japonicum]MBR0809458.1 hypothetical protein [Bradyrhizobium japonicum]